MFKLLLALKILFMLYCKLCFLMHNIIGTLTASTNSRISSHHINMSV